ncbi:MAG: sugar phosphate nucleotidyltransferase [Firmicutes bacterium]|nr:sugar phosphate nucleotidyltransferase [Bacillota bacterium]
MNKQSKIKKALLPCGGLGTRFYPVASVLPKEMLPLFGKPVLHYLVYDLIAQGVNEICFVVSPQKSAIKEYFSNHALTKQTIAYLKKQGDTHTALQLQEILDKAKFFYVEQETPKGSGDAVNLAKDFVSDDPCLLSWGDDIVFGDWVTDLTKAYDATSGVTVGVMTILGAEIEKYGVVAVQDAKQSKIALPDGLYQCFGMVEKPPKGKEPSRLASIGKYVITPQIFEALRQCKPAKNGEYLFTDALQKLCPQIYATVMSGRRYDLGDAQGLLQASLYLAGQQQG